MKIWPKAPYPILSKISISSDVELMLEFDRIEENEDVDMYNFLYIEKLIKQKFSCAI